MLHSHYQLFLKHIAVAHIELHCHRANLLLMAFGRSARGLDNVSLIDYDSKPIILPQSSVQLKKVYLNMIYMTFLVTDTECVDIYQTTATHTHLHSLKT